MGESGRLRAGMPGDEPNRTDPSYLEVVRVIAKAKVCAEVLSVRTQPP